MVRPSASPPARCNGWIRAVGLLLVLASGCGAAVPPVLLSGRSEYLVDVWDTDQGLPNYGVTSITQTDDGYLWVATFEGLAQFDGVKFEVVNRHTTPGFPGNLVSSVYQDRQGRLWAGTDGGTACFRDGRWRVYARNDGRPLRLVTRFMEDRQGNLLASSDNRLFRLAGERFVGMTVPARLRQSMLFADREGGLWAASDQYLGNFRNGRWQNFSLPPDLRGTGIRGVGSSRDGGIWLAGGSGIRKFRNGVWEEPRNAPAGFQFTAPVYCLEDSEGNVWAGDYWKGVLEFRADGRVLQFTAADGMPNPAIRTLFEDRERNIWVGTDGGGLVRLRPRLARVLDATEGLPVAVVDSVYEQSSGRMLVGTYGGGLVQFDQASMRFSPPVLPPGPGAGLQERSLVLSVVRDPAGDVWVGTHFLGLLRIHEGVMKQILAPDPHEPAVTALYLDSQATLWIGTQTGLASYAGGRLARYGVEAGLPPGNITAIVKDSRGTLWVGGTKGLFRKQGEHFQAVVPPGFREYGRIDSLFADDDGTLWIAAEDRVLDRLHDGVFTAYGPAQGLPDSRVGSILKDEQGRYWLATARQGLVCVPRSSLDAVMAGKRSQLELIWLRKEDGLATNQFRVGYQPAAFRAGDGRLWFATLKGLAVVDPKRIKRNPWIPPVWIEAVDMGGRRVDFNGKLPAKLEIPAGTSQLRLSYTALSFTDSDANPFSIPAGWIGHELAERDRPLGRFFAPGPGPLRVSRAGDEQRWRLESGWGGAGLPRRAVLLGDPMVSTAGAGGADNAGWWGGLCRWKQETTGCQRETGEGKSVAPRSRAHAGSAAQLGKAVFDRFQIQPRPDGDRHARGGAVCGRQRKFPARNRI